MVDNTLVNENILKSLEMAKKEGVSIQDCIRNKLFDLRTIYTPVETVRRALDKYEKGERFTLPKLYDGEWNIQRWAAGVFRKQFYNYISEECPDKISFVEMTNYGRHAQYQIL